LDKLPGLGLAVQEGIELRLRGRRGDIIGFHAVPARIFMWAGVPTIEVV
jgi:hypothetical protein